MPKDLNYPPAVKAGEFLFDWDEDHYHEYRHSGTPWFIRIQRRKDDPSTAFICFRDLFSDVEIPMPPNVRIRDEDTWRDVPKYQNGDYYRIQPFTSYTMLIHNCVPCLHIAKLHPPYFSVIRPAEGVTGRIIEVFKPEDKKPPRP